MNYILISWYYGHPSIQRVISLMENDCGILAKKEDGWYLMKNKRNQVWKKIHSIYSYIGDEDNNIINWGNYIFAEDRYFKINKPSAIRFCSNKALSRKILQDNHIAVPKTWYTLQEAQIPFIARPEFHHKGKQFYIVDTEIKKKYFDYKYGMYYSAIFPKTHEYRIHCAHGKVLLINEKPLIKGDIRANQAITREAWKYIKWSEYNSDICRESLKACKVLSLDCGAVDIMYNANNNTCAICEINTAPTLCDSEYNSKRHAMYFDWLINNNFPEHYDFMKWKNNISFSFKNNQLKPIQE